MLEKKNCRRENPMIPFLFHSTVFGSSSSLASPFRREPKRHPKRVSSEFQRLRTWNLRSSKYFASWIVKRYFFIFNTARISPKKKGLKESQCSSKAQRTFSKRFCLIIVTLPVFQKLSKRGRGGGERKYRVTYLYNSACHWCYRGTLGDSWWTAPQELGNRAL